MNKILIVDDDSDITSLLALQLTNENFKVDIAVDAIQALQHMRQNKPDLLILDINIPAGSAFTIVDSVKTIPDFIGIPFIFLTKNKDPKLEQKSLQLGAKAYLTKPYELQNLLKTIKSIL